MRQDWFENANEDGDLTSTVIIFLGLYLVVSLAYVVNFRRVWLSALFTVLNYI